MGAFFLMETSVGPTRESDPRRFSPAVDLMDRLTCIHVQKVAI